MKKSDKGYAESLEATKLAAMKRTIINEELKKDIDKFRKNKDDVNEYISALSYDILIGLAKTMNLGDFAEMDPHERIACMKKLSEIVKNLDKNRPDTAVQVNNMTITAEEAKRYLNGRTDLN